MEYVSRVYRHNYIPPVSFARLYARLFGWQTGEYSSREKNLSSYSQIDSIQANRSFRKIFQNRNISSNVKDDESTILSFQFIGEI